MKLSLIEDLRYLRSIRIYVYLAVFLFLFSINLGYNTAENDPDVARAWTDEIKVLHWIVDQPSVIVLIIIFLKNLLACALSVFLGLGLGIVPFLVITSNGFLLGIIGYGALLKKGWLFLAAGILPHGLIEIPAVLISVSLGFRLGYLLALSIMRRNEKFGAETKIAFQIFFKRVAPLLLLAASIEAYITPIAISVVE
jgi:stage II sporulation protein M